ncbi:hypothetical protein TNCV_3873501 [Trichonephila clavipes]|nr:hypothetical protein TNCV_3873501 [Trichonephila clavipes]
MSNSKRRQDRLDCLEVNARQRLSWMTSSIPAMIWREAPSVDLDMDSHSIALIMMGIFVSGGQNRMFVVCLTRYVIYGTSLQKKPQGVDTSTCCSRLWSSEQSAFP